MPKRKVRTAGAGRAEVPASDVKKGWHEYLDRVSRGGEEIVITRHGKAVARLAPVEPAADAPRPLVTCDARILQYARDGHVSVVGARA